MPNKLLQAPTPDDTPKAEESSSSTVDLIRNLLAGGVRVAGQMGGTVLGGAAGALLAPETGGLSALAIPGMAAAGGATGGALGEALAQKIEPHKGEYISTTDSNNVTSVVKRDRPINKGRVAVAAGLGAVPGSWMIRSGKPLVSAALGGGLGYAGMAGNKLAEGETPDKALNPLNWSTGDLVSGPGAGSVIGGVLGKFTSSLHGSPKAEGGPVAPTIPEKAPAPRAPGETGQRSWPAPTKADLDALAKKQQPKLSLPTKQSLAAPTVKQKGLTPLEISEVTKDSSQSGAAAGTRIGRERVEGWKKGLNDLSSAQVNTRESTTLPTTPQPKAPLSVVKTPTATVTAPEASKDIIIRQRGDTIISAKPEAPSEATIRAMNRPENPRLKASRISTERSESARLTRQEQSADLQNTKNRMGGADIGTINRDVAKAESKNQMDNAIGEAKNLTLGEKKLAEISKSTDKETADILKNRQDADKATVKMLEGDHRKFVQAQKATQSSVHEQGKLNQTVAKEELNQSVIDAQKEGKDPSFGNPRQTFKAGDESVSKTWREPPPPDEGSAPQGPKFNDVFHTKAEAEDAAIKVKDALVKPVTGGYKIVPKELVEKPTPDWRAVPKQQVTKASVDAEVNGLVGAEPSATAPAPGQPPATPPWKPVPPRTVQGKKSDDGVSFFRRSREADQARLTPEVRAELQAMVDEHELRPNDPAFPSSKVREDILAKAPLSGPKAKNVAGSHEQVRKAIMAPLERSVIDNHLSEGAVRAAEDRIAARGQDLVPEAPAPSPTAVPKAVAAEADLPIERRTTDRRNSMTTGGRRANDLPSQGEPIIGERATDTPLEQRAKFDQFMSSDTPEETARWNGVERRANDFTKKIHGDRAGDLPVGKDQLLNNLLKGQGEGPKSLPSEPAIPGLESVLGTENPTPKVAEAPPFSLTPEVAQSKGVTGDLLSSAAQQSAERPSSAFPFRSAPETKFNSPAELAGAHYEALQKATKAGEVPEVPGAPRNLQPARRAGAAARRTSAEAAAVNPTSEELASMPEAQRNAVLKKIVEAAKGQKGEIDPLMLQLLGRAGIGLAGAGIGSIVDEDHPVRGALIGGALGTGGFYGIQKLLEQPEIGQKIGDGLMAAARAVPSVQRFNLLSSFPNLMYNAWLGPYSANITGAIEQILSGNVAEGGAALKASISPVKFTKDMIKKFPEAAESVGKNERGELMAGEAPGRFQRTASIPGTIMTSGDMAGRDSSMGAGLSEEVARAITLTDEPWMKLLKWLVDGTRGNPAVQTVLPFVRTSANIVEGGLERTPILGLFVQMAKKYSTGAADAPGAIIAQQGLGGAIGYGAYWLGKTLDPETVKTLRIDRAIANMGGQYSMVAAAGFTMGQASRAGKTPTQILGSGASNALSNLPLPTTQTPQDVVKSVYGMMTGEPAHPAQEGVEKWLPRAAVPGILRKSEQDNYKAIYDKLMSLAGQSTTSSPTSTGSRSPEEIMRSIRSMRTP